MVKEGYPFVIAGLVVTIIVAIFQLWILVAMFGLITLFAAYFFRNPTRIIPTEPDVIVSPADGRVTRIDENEHGKLISIFLSPLDVHVNRSPIAGTVTKIDYFFGKKMPATSDNASLINERNSLLIEGEKIAVTVTQIAGIVARRIVCWSKEGDQLERGQLFGLIKFSSRTDLQMPANVDVLVNVDDKVKGGETIVARINDRSN